MIGKSGKYVSLESLRRMSADTALGRVVELRRFRLTVNADHTCELLTPVQLPAEARGRAERLLGEAAGDQRLSLRWRIDRKGDLVSTNFIGPRLRVRASGDGKSVTARWSWDADVTWVYERAGATAP